MGAVTTGVGQATSGVIGLAEGFGMGPGSFSEAPVDATQNLPSYGAAEETPAEREREAMDIMDELAAMSGTTPDDAAQNFAEIRAARVERASSSSQPVRYERMSSRIQPLAELGTSFAQSVLAA